MTAFHAVVASAVAFIRNCATWPRSARRATHGAAMHRNATGPKHAVCITGLQRSYPEISHNIHYSLSNLYSGWRSSHHGAGRHDEDGDHGLRRAATFSLERSVGFFGVRPANDSWATVRTDLPPLLGESIQTPCGLGRAPWFSAYAKTTHQRVTYAFSFIQMMCDMKACHELIKAHERRVGRQFATLARLRLDLAWETPLEMPPHLAPNTVYTSRMNTKAGLNDKWALGRREPMGVYFDRVDLIPLANALHNRSAKPATARAAGGKEGLVSYDCAAGSINTPFACKPRHPKTTMWQFGSAEAPPQQRKFAMTSESFLIWALWRGNVSTGYEPSWMFCKFGNSVNTTARTCVPRMRVRRSCRSLICTGTLTDCGCRNTTCHDETKGKKGGAIWYCEMTRGKQLWLDPYKSNESVY